MAPLPHWLVPPLSLADLRLLLKPVAVGSLVAGLYGVVHDYVTYQIGPSYFHDFKFEQFQWANLGWPPLRFAMLIGFLASWWVGGISMYILARTCLPLLRQDASRSRRMLWRSLAKIMGLALVGFSLACVAGRFWAEEEFARVAWIHNSGYAGAFLGLIWAWWSLKRLVRDKSNGIRGETS